MGIYKSFVANWILAIGCVFETTVCALNPQKRSSGKALTGNNSRVTWANRASYTSWSNKPYIQKYYKIPTSRKRYYKVRPAAGTNNGRCNFYYSERLLSKNSQLSQKEHVPTSLKHTLNHYHYGTRFKRSIYEQAF